MGQSATGHVAEFADAAPFDVHNATGQSQMVFVCEHASNFVPSRLAGQLATDIAIQSHAGWDPGALDLAICLSEKFDAPLVAATISRLVYDLNRPPDSPDAIRASSEAYDIPGNATLSSDERFKRIEEIYIPFHNAVSKALSERPDPRVPTVLITVHTFAPVYLGQARDVQIGILHDEDSRFADAMLATASDFTDLDVRRNEPYSPSDGVTHTLRKHTDSDGFLSVMIEVRNDLVATQSQQAEIATLLLQMIEVATTCTCERRPTWATEASQC